MEIDQKRIEDAVIKEVCYRLIGDDMLWGLAKTRIKEKVDEYFQRVAEKQIEQAICNMITEGFDHVYTKLDSFGRKIGEPTTVRQELEKHIQGYWNTRVDSQGKPVTNDYRTVTRAEWLMTKMVATDFEGEMKQHVVNVGGTLKDKLRGELHETVNRLLSEVFLVRSHGDEAMKRGDRSIIQPKQTGDA